MHINMVYDTAVSALTIALPSQINFNLVAGIASTTLKVNQLGTSFVKADIEVRY